MPKSDIEIKAKVRAVLSKHWVDLHRIGFDCCRGTVRFRGELSWIPGHEGATDEASLLEVLEAEIRRIRGVSKVYFLGVKLVEPERTVPDGEEDLPRTRLTFVTRGRSADEENEVVVEVLETPSAASPG